jgi:NADH-quinone oxidoreductase subunit A
MDQYLPLLVMLILAGLFAGLSFVASRIMAPRRPTPAKQAPYESGIVPDTRPKGRFPVRFYLVAMIFIIFDIEIIFIYPWAVIYRGLGTFGLFEMLLFAAAVFISFVYLIGNGALSWGPPKGPRDAAPADAQGAGRSTTSTVRRVSARSSTPPTRVA